jgi:hypothetical protein
LALAALLSFSALPTQADEFALNPQVKKIVDEVSEERIRSIIEHLVSFGTRNLLSNPDKPDHGIGAARQWIFDQFKSYSPRLQVRFDKWRVKKNGQRIWKDVDLYNVVAVLPGKTSPETQIVISGHYDSLNLGTPRAGQAASGPGSEAQSTEIGARPTQSNWEANAELPAPGACDDGSGTAATMELARVMSQYEFDKTLVFIAFAGEEQGLVGSTLEAAKAKAEHAQIEAVLNNDIIGTEVSGNGRSDNSTVSVYGSDISDSPAQQLARYVKLMGERYMPSMKVNVIFMEDRLGRGGDHTPFVQEGFAAVRISTPNEVYANQHHATDTLENMSVPYTTRVAKVNAAVMASLGLSPKAPLVTRIPAQGGANGRGAQHQSTGSQNAQAQSAQTQNAQPESGRGGRAGNTGGAGATAGAPGRGRGPMIGRGKGYDAVLTWRPAGSEDNIKGYSIVIRPTTSPFWEQEVFVGKVNTYTFPDVSVDDVRFGVKAIGNDGTESLITPYVYPPRNKATYEATPLP